MRFTIGFIFMVACFGQGKENRAPTGFRDDSALNWLAPSGTYAARPGSPATGQVYVVTDTLCDGTGTGPATCRWSGSAWVSIGGATTQTAIFTGGTQVQKYVQCTYGTVSYTALTAAASSQEISILTGISGNVRFDQIIVNPSTAFTGGAATAPTVSMGRTGTNNQEMTGATVAIGSGSVFWSTRPSPPVLTGTYSLVLNFAASTANLGTGSASNFTAGSLDWEVCGYAAH